MPDEFDSPWKEGLEKYLRSILEFCFPNVAAAIDWRIAPEFLDKELQEVVRDSAVGRRYVDKLVKVTLHNRQEEWVLIHVEVQHEKEEDFAERVFEYRCAIRQRFKRKIATLAILADENPDWCPSFYEEEALGCRVRFDFLVCKLLDLVDAAKVAAAETEPSAVIILANWATQQSQHDTTKRSLLKWELTRQLYEAGYEKQIFWSFFG